MCTSTESFEIYLEKQKEGLLSHRERVVCGKVSEALYDRVKGMVLDGTYKTMNDLVEEAVLLVVVENAWRTEVGGGC